MSSSPRINGRTAARLTLVVGAVAAVLPIMTPSPVHAAPTPSSTAIALAQPPNPVGGVSTPSADAAVAGMFSGVKGWPVVPLHVGLMPSGTVVSYGTPVGVSKQIAMEYDNWDPSKGFGEGSHRQSPRTDVNSFCNIAALTGAGTVMMVGGTSVNSSGIYDPSSLSSAATGATVSPRWYGSMVRMPDDTMVMVGGAQPGHVNMYQDPVPNEGFASSMPEVFTPGSGWAPLPGAASTALFGAGQNRWWYPKAYVAPDGSLFGISYDTLWSLDPRGAGSVRSIGTVPGTGVGASASSVMFAPGQILLAGGGQRSNEENSPASASASIIDITGMATGAAPTVTEIAPMAAARNWGNLTLLANGEVLMNGGTGFGTQGPTAVYQGEIWNPGTRTWRPAATAAQMRTYHSTSLLMPSGAVLTGGGGVPGPQVNFNTELYFPPYLFTKTADGGSAWADRAELRTIDGTLAYGSTVRLTVSDERPMSSMSLIKLGMVTHSYGVDARSVPLSFTQSANGLDVALPADRNLAPPGFYLMQAVDAKGVPTPAQIIELRSDGAPGAITIYGKGTAVPGGTPVDPPPPPPPPVDPPAAPTTPAAPLTAGTRIGLEPIGMSGQRVRHAQFKAILSGVSSDSSALAIADSTFVARPGLGNPTCVSFESTNYPGYFLRHRKFAFVLTKYDGSSLNAADATLCPRAGLVGTGTTFESVNYPGRFMRRRGGAIVLEAPDGTAGFAAEASFGVVVPFAPLTVGTRISLQPDRTPNAVVRHARFKGIISPIGADVSPLTRADATFTVRTGMADPACVSFESVNYPGYYLRHRKSVLVLTKYDGSSLNAKDATFCVRPGLAGHGTSFESKNFPGRYLMRRKGAMVLDTVGPTPAMAANATFAVLSGLS